jgi:hypothetical protein
MILYKNLIYNILSLKLKIGILWVSEFFTFLLGWLGLDYYFYSIVALPYGGVIVCSVFFLYNKHIAWRIQMYLSGRRGCSSRSASEICCSSPARKANREGTFIVMSSFHNEIAAARKIFSFNLASSLSCSADLLHYPA